MALVRAMYEISIIDCCQVNAFSGINGLQLLYNIYCLKYDKNCKNLFTRKEGLGKNLRICIRRMLEAGIDLEY
jgi:hypothetical protein